MLDPPPFANAMLRQHAIPSSIIESIIISHCHADHDAGAFQKILESQKVEVYCSFMK
jgi:phosphoribosyl 1,2-cyclic phosphodiesterase